MKAARARLLTDVATIVVIVVLLMPIIWVMVASLKENSDIMSGGFLPRRITFEHYAAILAKRDFLTALRNSLVVGLVVGIATVVIALPAAYSLSRFQYRGRDGLAFMILATQMLPSIAVLVPLVVIIRALGMANTLIALAVTHLALTLPVAVWILKGYIDSIPPDLEEASMMDGSSRIGAIVRITFPLIRPATVAVGTFAFVLSWGEFVLALALLSRNEVKTLPLALQTLFDPYTFSWGQVMAGGTVIALPAIVLFLIFRNQLVGGLTAGGTKG